MNVEKRIEDESRVRWYWVVALLILIGMVMVGVAVLVILSWDLRIDQAEQVGSEDFLYGGIRLITQVESNSSTPEFGETARKRIAEDLIQVLSLAKTERDAN